ncbi:MAG TPA: glycosyltransferase family 2 protein [Desulfobacterales bacterium]|nr:glycosyltransferase family 2 protein [Desulfobacterales bacterium]
MRSKIVRHNISICMSAYNGAKYISPQIDSILSQTYQQWRLFVRDDGSSDNTLVIINEYVSKYPEKIRLVDDNLGRLGPSLNFGKLLEFADSEYIMFCDQDDVWLPNKIELTLNAMEIAEKLYPQKPILVHTDLRVVDNELNMISDSLWDYQLLFPDIANNPARIMAHNVVTGCTVMINKPAKAISTPIPREALMYDWWIAIKASKAGKIVHVSTPTVLYRQHSDNECGAKCARYVNIFIFFKKLYHVRKLLSAQYKMITKADPNASFWSMVFNKFRIKISQRCR